MSRCCVSLDVEQHPADPLCLSSAQDALGDLSADALDEKPSRGTEDDPRRSTDGAYGRTRCRAVKLSAGFQSSRSRESCSGSRRGSGSGSTPATLSQRRARTSSQVSIGRVLKH